MRQRRRKKIIEVCVVKMAGYRTWPLPIGLLFEWDVGVGLEDVRLLLVFLLAGKVRSARRISFCYQHRL